MKKLTIGTLNFTTAFKRYPTSGNLVYEYNPFYNYRLNQTMISYKGIMYTLQDFASTFGYTYNEAEEAFYKGNTPVTNWDDFDETPTVYQKGQLVDFETNELHFSLNNPVNITPQWSYDDSVNLIINDGLNPPRLINSRFSVTERNKYQVCNRKGENDTNIYDQGEQFDIDTSLYKKTITIPKLDFLGVTYGGVLGIGNYHFYFKYVDEDGNESDFFAESGLVSIFIGNSADSIYTGWRDQNSFKQVKFILSNTDSGYSKIVIYYTKATGDINENATVNAYRIDTTYEISKSGNTLLSITGYEPYTEVSIEDINTRYQIYGAVETQAAAQNMLFLGNLSRPNIPYQDLADCALRFLPTIDTTQEYPLSQVNQYYAGKVTNTYYDPNFIYSKVGYWDDEFYRFGVVFIQADNTLTDVFNIRGAQLTPNDKYYNYTQIPLKKGDNRNYISYDETYYNITDESGNSKLSYENAKGVVYIKSPGFKTINGIKFYIDKETIEYLQKTYNIRGFFFVRQKRIPTTLCQAYTIGIDKESNTPVLPQKGNIFVTESFLSKGDRVITHDFSKRKIEIQNYQVRTEGAICPEYDINSPYLNTIFSGAEAVCRTLGSIELNNNGDNYFYITEPTEYNPDNSYQTIKVIGVEDNVKLVAINDSMFSARAGEAEEGFRFEFAGRENKDTNADNLLRGSYGPYLGITEYNNAGNLINIKIPGFSLANIQDYFSIRYNDKSPFYAISDRYDISDPLNYDSDKQYEDNESLSRVYKPLYDTIYRGDCYICQFTHRLNRNFQDPSAPTNDEIVDPNTWKDNFEVNDNVINTEKFDTINLGDLNAVKLGMYITLIVRSTNNLNIRSIDDSNVDEAALFGHNRGFYPHYPLTNDGSYKIPEALCYNKGFEKSVSERISMETPDVPWIKNEFSNRIAYSNIQIQDAFQNGWRTFMGTHYRDYPKTYGSITKLVELGGNLLCVFEHGIALIPVNERALAGEGSGGNVYINTSNVLPQNPKIISDIYGSQWRESIIKTPAGVYGVDTIAKKIWRTNGDTIELLSDFKVQEFLNQNISLTERELTPIIGVRNVKTHYNKYKLDVMFTFYDNLYGFEEKVWNLCYNEKLNEFITFYSWVPSYSENIYNQYFSFDRNTSKWIAKLGTSKTGSDFADGVTLSSVEIPNNYKNNWTVGELSLSNRNLPSNVNYHIEYTLERDNYGNYKNFAIYYRTGSVEGGTDPSTKRNYFTTYQEAIQDVETNNKAGGVTPVLLLMTDASNLFSEYYVREYTPRGTTYLLDKPNEETNSFLRTNGVRQELEETQHQVWSNNQNLPIHYDELGRPLRLAYKDQVNGNNLVILLNISAQIVLEYNSDSTLEELYATGYANTVFVNFSQYESVVALIPEYNMQFLTTDFWKHGQAGIIDIAEDINPTFWYGKQHPFEFEFVVADNPQAHKIFNNLVIISNNAEPESFHYEIIGDCYNFAKDKKNMYIRQEATKQLYQYNGCDIVYDHNYTDMQSVHRSIGKMNNKTIYDRSTILPLYYSRQDTINEIEDQYHLKDNVNTKDFSALAGGEIKYNKTTNEYSIWNHAKAVDMQKHGRLRGNMQYNEDKWLVQINPINVVYKNEEDWLDLDDNVTDKIPVELTQSPIPNEVLENTDNLAIPEDFQNRGYTVWNNTKREEVKLKDKWIKIRIRYTGDKLAIINAVKTLYSISYG